MMLDDFFQSQCLRTAIHNGQHIDTESILQMRLFVQHIDQIFRIGTFFQFQYNTDTFFGRLVGDISDLRSLSGLHKGSHIIQELADICADHRIRDL